MIHEQSLHEYRLREMDDAVRCMELVNSNPRAFYALQAVRELSERAMHRPAPKVLQWRPFIPDELRRVRRAVPEQHLEDARREMEEQSRKEAANKWQRLPSNESGVRSYVCGNCHGPKKSYHSDVCWECRNLEYSIRMQNKRTEVTA